MRTIKFVILTIIILSVLPLHAQIRAVVVDGNVRTKESIIERELGFTKDQPLIYSDSLLGIWRMRLESTKLFNWVEITKNSIGDTLNVHVVERWYIWVKPEGGFLDRNFSEWWKNRDIQRLSIGATVYVNNILGQQGGFFVRQAKGFMAADGFGFQRPFLKYKNCNAWKFSLDNMRSRRAWINSENNQVVIKEHWGIRQQEQLIGIAEYKRRFEYKWQGVVRYKFARDYAAQDIEALNPQYFIAPLGVVNSQYEDWKQYTHSLVLGLFGIRAIKPIIPPKGLNGRRGYQVVCSVVTTSPNRMVNLIQSTVGFTRWEPILRWLFWRKCAIVLAPWVISFSDKWAMAWSTCGAMKRLSLTVRVWPWGRRRGAINYWVISDR